MNILSLFAGCGGLDLGAMRAGLTITAAYESEASACRDYEAVTGHTVQQVDLTRIDLKRLPDSDGVIGGPPCQAFSRSNSQRESAGPGSIKNLWPVARDVIQAKRPAWFVFENVPYMLQNPRSREYFYGLVDAFTDSGYRVEYRILNAADYAVPQTRERLFLVGRRDGRAWQWPLPSHSRRRGLFTQQWISWRAAVADIIHEAEQAEIPNWIHRIPLYQNGWQTNAYFNTQEARHTRHHRDDDQPAFTVTTGGPGRIRIVLDNVIYRGNKRITARLQSLPDVPLTQTAIGNAVPPPLAEAIFREMMR